MVAERIPAGFPVERHGDLTRKAETDARIIWFSTGEAPDPSMREPRSRHNGKPRRLSQAGPLRLPCEADCKLPRRAIDLVREFISGLSSRPSQARLKRPQLLLRSSPTCCCAQAPVQTVGSPNPSVPSPGVGRSIMVCGELLWKPLIGDRVLLGQSA